MTYTHDTHETPDEAVTRHAENHRATHGHTVYVMPGAGWVCETCDEDYEDVIADYIAGTLDVPSKHDTHQED